MIAPALPLPQPLAPTPQGTAAASADPFERVLAAAALRADPLGATPVAPVPDLPLPETREGEDREPQRHHAHVFNQTGFFGTPTQHEAQASEMPAASLDPPEIQARTEPAVPGAGRLDGVARTSVGRPGTPAVARNQDPRAPARGPQASLPKQIAATAQPAAPPRLRAPVKAAPVREAAPSRERPPARSTTTAAVAILELGAGLEVVARVAALGEAERGVLHDAIAALLSEHGIAVGDIRIAAPRALGSSKGRTK